MSEPTATDPPEPASREDEQDTPRPTASLRERSEELRARADETWRRVEAARARSSAVDAAFETYEHDRDGFGPLIAAALAFRLFLVLVPFVAFAAIVVGFVLPEEPDLEARGLFGLTAQTIADVADQPLWSRIVTLVVVGWALVLGARSLTKALRLAHIAAWRLERPTFRDTTKASLVLLGFATAAIAVTGLARQAREVSDAGGALITTLVVFATYLVAWIVASTALPRAPGTTWTATIPGAVLFAVGAQAFHLVVVFWIVPRIDNAQAHYGALGIAIVLLGGVYLLGRVIVASAFLNATLWFRRQPGGGGAGSGGV